MVIRSTADGDAIVVYLLQQPTAGMGFVAAPQPSFGRSECIAAAAAPAGGRRRRQSRAAPRTAARRQQIVTIAVASATSGRDAAAATATGSDALDAAAPSNAAARRYHGRGGGGGAGGESSSASAAAGHRRRRRAVGARRRRRRRLSVGGTTTTADETTRGDGDGRRATPTTTTEAAAATATATIERLPPAGDQSGIVGVGVGRIATAAADARQATAEQRQAALQFGEPLLAALRLDVDETEEDAHDEDRQVVGGKRRGDGDVLVRLEELDVALVRRHRTAALDERPGDDPRRPEEEGHEPGEGDHREGARRRPPGAVRQRPGDGEVAVEADDEQVGNGCVRHRVVEGEPRVADDRTERPVVQQEVEGVEWHRDESDGEVGDGQAQEEVVAHLQCHKQVCRTYFAP